jgi:hypothetical protein
MIIGGEEVAEVERAGVVGVVIEILPREAVG